MAIRVFHLRNMSRLQVPDNTSHLCMMFVATIWLVGTREGLAIQLASETSANGKGKHTINTLKLTVRSPSELYQQLCV